MPRIIRKPVPQISICSQCGHDFKYMRSLRPRLYCDDCADKKRLIKIRAWQAKKRKE